LKKVSTGESGADRQELKNSGPPLTKRKKTSQRKEVEGVGRGSFVEAQAKLQSPEKANQQKGDDGVSRECLVGFGRKKKYKKGEENPNG